MGERQSERTESALPVDVQVNRNGGATGLTAVVAVRDGATTNQYLDFDDDTFKGLGHGTRQAALTEISAANAPGIYSLVGGLDIAAITNLSVNTNHLILEFTITGSVKAAAIDVVLLRDRVHSNTEIVEMYARLGLKLGTPAVHTPTTIDAGAEISQSVAVVGPTVTVSRDP